MGWVAVIVAGAVLAVSSWWHIGGTGTGGRPFVIVLALGVAAVFLLEEWTGR